jgi:hypothetical protein
MHTLMVLILFSIVSNYLFFGLPFFSSMFIFITTLTAFVFARLITYSNHLSLFYLILFTIDATYILSLTYSFLILSSFVTLLIYLSIFISVTLILCSILLSTTQHCEPYRIVVLATLR